jgi:hypothetical protein
MEPGAIHIVRREALARTRERIERLALAPQGAKLKAAG